MSPVAVGAISRRIFQTLFPLVSAVAVVVIGVPQARDLRGSVSLMQIVEVPFEIVVVGHAAPTASYCS
jgi:phosphoribosylcarboxyaminoimidazole (NCAIR) mutase